MESGAMAGRAAADALAAGSPETASARYRREYAEIARSLRVANRLRFAVLPPPAQRYLRRKLKGPGAESMIRRHMDLMAGNLDYRTFCLESVRRKLRL
jgi:flavin-dependent dehydrogenase